MTRSDLIAAIKATAAVYHLNIPALSKMRKAELVELHAYIMTQAEAKQDAWAKNQEEIRQSAADARAEAFTPGTLVTANYAPGVWEVTAVHGTDRLLSPVDPEAKDYASELPSKTISRRASDLWTGEPESIRQAALAISSELPSGDLFDLAWDARDRGEFWAAYVLDNMAEDAGGHADARTTCHACGTWANHTHVGLSGVKTYEWPQVDTDASGIVARVHPVQTVTV